MSDDVLVAARRILDNAVMTYRGRPVGTVAARPPDAPPAADNYTQCFVRDFAVSGLVYLAEGRAEIVRNFLQTVLDLLDQEVELAGQEIQPGVMPASFIVRGEGMEQSLLADFGNRAIGRVAPVDSMMWWTLLLYAYTHATGDTELVQREGFQRALRAVLSLCLQASFEVFPTLLVPDGSFMVDRRMGVHGHPLEIQALFFGMLQAMGTLRKGDGAQLLRAAKRRDSLRGYVRRCYWLDLPRLAQIHRYHCEEYGDDSVNFLNIFPESLPGWVEPWLPHDGGYLVGNLGPERLDVRFFAQGNLLAVLFGLASEGQAHRLMALYERRWDVLVGAMPAKICYPAMVGEEWRALTGCDPKNAAWSYHNGGNWPVLLWSFVAAALRCGRRDLAERAYAAAHRRLPDDRWPEYYDGRTGRLIGRRANLHQVWSAAALLLARRLLDEPDLLKLFPWAADDGG